MAAVLEPKTTSLSELRQGIQPREATMPTVRAGFSDLAGFELVQRAAKALSASTLVPKEYQGNVPNCIVALELAQRIGASPLMVMQNLAIIHGKPSWSSKFLIASVNQCGRFTELQFEWSGKEGSDEWSCRAWAKSKATGERVQGPKISIKMAKAEGWYEKAGSKWKTIPELMLMYRAGGWFANTNAPELTMGLSTQEEMHDVIDVEPESTTTEEIRANAPAKPQASEPKPAAEPGAFSFDAILGYIEKAESREIADQALDLANSLPPEQRAKCVEAWNKRFATTVE